MKLFFSIFCLLGFACWIYIQYGGVLFELFIFLKKNLKVINMFLYIVNNTILIIKISLNGITF